MDAKVDPAKNKNGSRKKRLGEKAASSQAHC